MTSKQRILFTLSILAAAALFAFAAFFLAQRLKPQTTQVQLIPAPEIPQTAPDLVGSAVRAEANSLMVMEGSPELVAVKPGKNGEVIMESQHAGIVWEVLVTQDTRMYLDTTFDEPNPPKEGSIQQRVQPAALSQLQSGGRISVWGEKRGERLVAEVILYQQPVPMQEAQTNQ